MSITLESIVLVLLLVVALESLMPSLAPRRWQQMLTLLVALPAQKVRHYALLILLGALTLIALLQ